MAPFVALPNGAQVQLVFQLGGQIVQNRLWFLNRQPPNTPAQLDALAAGVTSWHTSEVLPLLSDQLLLAAVEAFDWTADPPPYVGVTTPLLSGGISGACQSANVAVRISWVSSSGSRIKRNSNFLPGIPDSVLDINTIDPLWGGNLVSAYIDLIDLAPLMGSFPAWEWVSTSAWLSGSLRAEQDWARVDFPYLPSVYSTQRRKRLPPA